MSRIATFFVFMYGLLIGACQSESALDASPPREKIVISGSSTLAPMISVMAKTFEQDHPNFRIDVQTGGSSRGINDVQLKLADIGMVSRHLEDTDTYRAHTIAQDGVTMIVHKNNPLTSLNKNTIIAIYQKQILDWSGLTTFSGDITVISKAEGRSTLEVFLHYLGLKNSELRPDSIIGDNEQAVKLVVNNPNAIAYVSSSTAESHIKNGSPIKTIQIDGVIPSTENVANGKFPIVRKLNLIASPSPSTAVKQFLEFCSSVQGKRLIEEFHFVPSV
ncbi:MAG: phosphate ABC transporter substrate-binding protein [Gammaproteobacteria bacterium]|nr:phosphate ABC transporter substrate-binding protein [Gammaproteobacteria bacterium]